MQVGANDNEVININLDQINAIKLGLGDFQVNGDRLATEDDLVNLLGATGFDIYTSSVISGDASVTKNVTYNVRNHEVSEMSRNQVLQEAGTAVLAQSNQVIQAVLSLLR